MPDRIKAWAGCTESLLVPPPPIAVARGPQVPQRPQFGRLRLRGPRSFTRRLDERPFAVSPVPHCDKAIVYPSLGNGPNGEHPFVRIGCRFHHHLDGPKGKKGYQTCTVDGPQFVRDAPSWPWRHGALPP